MYINICIYVHKCKWKKKHKFIYVCDNHHNGFLS